ncbi:MAG: 1-acyl-sn-glycerol-3-phosphate acyltransferase [Leptonema sp. (in: Bacteria)]|nr:1-acyl-sn-glycerol-3-phosphate acyltransferase [Leptonema sp. (in: bacteria)]
MKRRGYRFKDHLQIRHKFKEIRKILQKRKHNLLICANHLTMIDSVILQAGFGSFWYYLFNYGDFAWNVPAKEVFANHWYSRTLLYLSKCIPIDRLGSKEHHEEIIQKMKQALSLGDPFIVFPEGGRSRTNRFDMERLTYGIGRLLREDQSLEVLCVYLRSDKQNAMTVLPPNGSNFYCNFELLKPQTDQKGLRADRDLAIQVGHKIQELEEQYFNLKTI